jgi:hypothetical protein
LSHIISTMIFRNCALILLLCATADAFSPSKVPAPLAVRATTVRATSSLLVLSAEEKKKGGLDGSLRNKLVSESIAPWRTIRLFLYGSFASGAFVGGLINGSGAIAGMNSPEFNLNTEVSFFYCQVPSGQDYIIWNKGANEKIIFCFHDSC